MQKLSNSNKIYSFDNSSTKKSIALSEFSIGPNASEKIIFSITEKFIGAFSDIIPNF